MINFNELSLWLLFLNTISILTAVFSFIKISSGKIKTSLIILIFINLLWYSSIFITQFFVIDEAIITYISRLIFAFAYLMFLAFAFFLYTFSEENLKTAGIYATAGLGIIMIAGSLSGMVDGGVKLTDVGYKPVYGFLHPYYIASIGISGIYLFYRIWGKYKNISSELIKFQFEFILTGAALAFSGILLTNGILPMITGKSIFSLIGPFFSLLFFGGVAYILANGPVITVKKSFNRLLKESERISDLNIQSIREFVGLMQFAIKDEPEKFQRQITLYNNKNNSSALYIGTEDNLSGPAGSAAESIPHSWTKGMMDSLFSLESDNKKMAFSLIRAESMFRDKWLGDAVSSLPPSRIKSLEVDSYDLEDIKKTLFENRTEYGNLFGDNVICFSSEIQKLYNTAMDYAKSTQLISISGDTGTGRSTLVRAIHFNRKGGNLTEISCLNETPDSLSNAIRHFISLPDGKRPEGLFFRHMDALPPEEFKVLDPVLKDFHGKKYIYMTVSNNFYLNEPGINREIYHRLIQLSLHTTPLADRQDDLFYQIFWFIHKHSKSSDASFKYVTKKLINRAMEYSWPGNSMELENAVRRALLDNKPPLLETISFHKLPEMTESKGHLSPLEESEQNVIFNQLQKNNYNKNKTSRDLKITINTLNAKMKLYGIHIPKK